MGYFDESPAPSRRRTESLSESVARYGPGVHRGGSLVIVDPRAVSERASTTPTPIQRIDRDSAAPVRRVKVWYPAVLRSMDGSICGSYARIRELPVSPRHNGGDGFAKVAGLWVYSAEFWTRQGYEEMSTLPEGWEEVNAAALERKRELDAKSLQSGSMAQLLELFREQQGNVQRLLEVIAERKGGTSAGIEGDPRGEGAGQAHEAGSQGSRGAGQRGSRGAAGRTATTG